MVTDNTVVTTTDYAGAYIYENSSLKFIHHPEGYIEPDGAGGYEYVYQYKDHLGNIRLSYSDSNNDGLVDSSEIMSEKNYYPFGLTHRGYNSQIQGTYYPYGFNGKEENDELGLNWLDFSARNYDATLGRWMNMDLLADANGQVHNAPYNYALNNPVVLTDPDGNCPPGVDCFSVAMGVLSTAKNYYSSVARGFSNRVDSAGEGLKQLISDPVGTIKAAAADHLDRVTNPARLIGDTVDAMSMVNPIVAIADDAAVAMSSGDPVSAVGEAQGERLADQTMAVAGEGAGAVVGRGISSLTKATKAATKPVTTANGVEVSGFTKHGLNQKITREVKSSDILNAFKDPLKTGDVKVDNLGRPSQRFTGGKAEVAINPQTGKVVSTNPTSTKKAARLKKQKEQE